MKVQIYSQWMEEVYVPVRVRQFAKAAKLMGKSFEEYAAASDVKADEADERQLVESWINKRSAAIASEDGRHLALRCAVADEAGVAAPAEGERQRVEQDGLASTSLAGQDRQPWRKANLKPLDQDNVADRERLQHGRPSKQQAVECLGDPGRTVLARLQAVA